MVIKKKAAVLVAAGVIAAALGVAAPAGADPADDPCQLGVTLLCRFLPMAPDLDHDIDLTQSGANLNGEPLPLMPDAGPNAEDAPPVDACVNGCS